MPTPFIFKCIPYSLAKCMGWIGGFIANHSSTTFFAWIALMLVMSLLGFNKMEFVTNNERLFVPHAATGLKVFNEFLSF